MVNTACFPVSYQDKYYKDVVAASSGGSDNSDSGLSKLAYVGGFVVGATSSRIEDIIVDDDGDSVNGVNGDGDGDGVGDVGDGVEQEKQKQKQKRKKKRIYIMTLGVFAAYRGRGIGTQLIQSILDYYYYHHHHSTTHSSSNNNNQNNDTDNSNKDEDSSSSSSSSSSLKDVVEISLHVHVNNDDAIHFYMSKFGFLKDPQQVNNYYNKRQIDPPHAIRLYKPLP